MYDFVSSVIAEGNALGNLYKMVANMIGNDIHSLAQRLWKINRSITGEGVRETLAVLKDIIPSLKIHSVPTDTLSLIGQCQMSGMLVMLTL